MFEVPPKKGRNMCERCERLTADLDALQAERAVDIRYMDECKAELAESKSHLKYEIDNNTEWARLYVKIEAERDRLKNMVTERDRLKNMVTEMQSLIRQSSGVDGLHLNGDIAPWETLMMGGIYEEWLPSWTLEGKP